MTGIGTKPRINSSEPWNLIRTARTRIGATVIYFEYRAARSSTRKSQTRKRTGPAVLCFPAGRQSRLNIATYIKDDGGRLGFADDVVAIENRSGFPSGEFHDHAFWDSTYSLTKTHLRPARLAIVKASSSGSAGFEICF
jgi:hypothetical protein